VTALKAAKNRDLYQASVWRTHAAKPDRHATAQNSIAAKADLCCGTQAVAAPLLTAELLSSCRWHQLMPLASIWCVPLPLQQCDQVAVSRATLRPLLLT